TTGADVDELLDRLKKKIVLMFMIAGSLYLEKKVAMEDLQYGLFSALQDLYEFWNLEENTNLAEIVEIPPCKDPEKELKEKTYWFDAFAKVSRGRQKISISFYLTHSEVEELKKVSPIDVEDMQQFRLMQIGGMMGLTIADLPADLVVKRFLGKYLDRMADFAISRKILISERKYWPSPWDMSIGLR
ncbi:MAG: hypothetical protein D6767_01125, partial [Candidatus Hydrogenedentota bacterium]